MKVCEAISSETGGKYGVLGDQTGKELRKRDWYDRKSGWDCCLVPKDPNKGKKAAEYAEYFVKSKQVGYDQKLRWTLWKELKAHNWDRTQIGACACDCSSLVITCYICAGADLLPTGYTGNLERILIESGEFKRYSGGEQYGCVGAVYIKKNAHALIVTEADSEPEEDAPASENLIKVKGESVRIRKTPKDGKTVRIVHKGDNIEIFGTDEATGWYKTADGYITNNERHVEKI